MGRSHGVLNYVNTRVILANILKAKRVCAQSQGAENAFATALVHSCRERACVDSDC